MPEPILKRLHRKTIAKLAEPELAAGLSASGSVPRASASRPDFARFISEETARWRPVVQASGASEAYRLKATLPVSRIS